MTATAPAAVAGSLSTRVFRAVLDALARPGTVTGLPAVSGLPSVLAPMAALADLDTPIHVLGEGGWAGAIATATSAPTASLDAARLVAALRPVTPAELRAVRAGTPADPEAAALVALAVPALDGGPAVRLRGPGTAPDAFLAAPGLPAGWTADRPAFPTGPDLLLVTPDGRCVGIPRSTRPEEVR